MAILHDGPDVVIVPPSQRPARLSGHRTSADLSCWDVAAVQRDMGHKRTGEIRQELDSLRCLPPLLREHLWHYVLALGLLACDRAMVLEVVDAAEAADAGEEVGDAA